MAVPEFEVHFALLEDPRINRTKKHLLVDILGIALAAVVCGAEGWKDLRRFGLAKAAWLRECLGLELANGIPSADTFRRVFGRLDPDAFATCLNSWVNSFQEQAAGREVVAMDGKTLRHSFDTVTGQAAMHLVTAWATRRGLALGQVKVADKSNEITAVPVLLKMLDLKGCIVTLDAMSCQKETAKQILAGQADYVLALKGNQTSLHEDVRLFFEDARANDFYEKDPQRRIEHGYHNSGPEKDHGRFEIRQCWTVKGEALAWLHERHPEWQGLNSICAVEGERRRRGKTTRETRYFISSLTGDAQELAQAVRAHWRIENGLHWVLDVVFREDSCGVWQDHGPQNLATLRRVAVSLLKQDTARNWSIKGKSKRASWDNDYLLQVLAGNTN